MIIFLKHDHFTLEEHAVSPQEFARYPKFFDIIAQSEKLRGGTLKDCVQHYYKTTLSTEYKRRKGGTSGWIEAKSEIIELPSCRREPAPSCQTLAEAARKLLEELQSEHKTWESNEQPPPTSNWRFMAGEKKIREASRETADTPAVKNEQWRTKTEETTQWPDRIGLSTRKLPPNFAKPVKHS